MSEGQMSAGKRNVEAIYPLSPLQQGMLFHSVYAPTSDVYFEQVSCAVHGDFDVEAFEEAWRQAVARHAILRSSFVWRGVAESVLVVHREVELALERQDWRSLSAAAQEESLEAFLDADRCRGFDLSRAPLMRLALLRTAEDVHRFVWSRHHLLLDAWSRSLLLDEVFATYRALRAGRTPALPAVRPYRDYVAWLRRQDAAAGEAYWRRALAGLSEPVRLAGDLGLPGAAASVAYDRHELRLSASTTAALRSLARAHELTLNTVVQGAWSLLLACYSERLDVVFGAVVSGRPADLPGAECMVGLFMNTLPVRVQVDPEVLLLPWLTELQRRQVEQRQHEHSSLVDVQGWSEVPRGLPLFETILVFENAPLETSLHQGNAGSELSDVRALGARTGYPLTVIAVPGAELTFEVTRDVGRFAAVSVDSLLGCLETLLSAMAADPGRRLADLPLLSEGDRLRLETWNRTEVAYRSGVCLHELIAEQAARTPEMVAVVCEEARLTYGELALRAGGLARRLRRLGVGPESRVALCAERSCEMVVGLLGILQAGAAYLPLDPEHPRERLLAVLSDAHPAALVAQARWAEELGWRAGAVILLPDETVEKESETSAWNLCSVVPEGLAYVIYTSGSTGRPKGAMNTHRAICNRLLWMQEAYRLGPDDRVLHKTPFGFDVSVWELFWPLLAGAGLVLARPGGHRDPVHLADLIRCAGITILHFVPSMLQAFVEEPAAAGCRSLRRVICSGEALPFDLKERALEVLGAGLENLYGPTEAAVDVTFWRCERGNGPAVPIGRPIANIQVHVVDRELRRVPIGVPGELLIGGVGLARGYLDRPGLTAERFIPDPFSGVSGARLYRTGDRVRHLPQGELGFLGRLDHQVKIRGFRIELGEIEAVLSAHPALREAAVLVRDNTPGGPRLVAYAVAREGAAIESGALRSFLAEKLPEPMVPAVVVPVSALPLSPNGKLDRRALALLAAPEPAGEAVPVPPRTPTEEVLAGLWAEVLGRDSVGVQDDFFALGGHSLLAMRLVSRLRAALGVEVPLRDLFIARTVEALARRIDGALGTGRSALAPPITPVARDGELPLSFAQQRLWFLAQLEPDNPFYNVPGALRLRGRLDLAVLARTFTEVVRRHEVLRTIFPSRAGQPFQQVLPPKPVPMPRIDLQALPPRERDSEALALAGREARLPFDLARGPLLRTALVEVGREEFLLLFTLHHIVSDHWSLGLLVWEVGTFYAALAAGEPTPLPELSIQYGDFAHWQRAWLEGGEMGAQLGYWRQRLVGAPAVLRLPAPRPRPAVPNYRGGLHSFALPARLAGELGSLARREGVTLFMLLLAAFQVLLYRLSGQDDVVLGTPIAGRSRGEAEGLIGCFINTLALRTDLSGNPTFRELLVRVREVTLGAFAHQDLPFERLVAELQPSRDSGAAPIFQITFCLQNGPSSPLGLPGVEVSTLAVPREAVRYDLTLWMYETGEELAGDWTYATDLFDAAAIEALARCFETLLSGVAARPEARLDALPVVHAAEKKRRAAEEHEREQRLANRLVRRRAVSFSGADAK